jgi:hypothetical protein
MKKLLLSAAAVATLFTACKKDEKKSENYFTLNGKTYNTPYGYNLQIENNLIMFVSISATTNPTKAFSEVDLAVDTLIDGNTYTLFSYNDGAEYDKTKNFADAAVYADVTLDGNGDVKTGKEYSSWSSGTVTVKKSGSGWAFTYQLKAGDSVTVKGQYTGTITDLNDLAGL